MCKWRSEFGCKADMSAGNQSAANLPSNGAHSKSVVILRVNAGDPLPEVPRCAERRRRGKTPAVSLLISVTAAALAMVGRVHVDRLRSILHPLTQMWGRFYVQDILFHQYESSPFSEKVRVCLGIKKLAWAAVDQPVIMPKPELVALTGGYRRIPVMQIGADIYCDSQLIVRELERRFPEPTLFPQGNHGLAYANAMWSDRSIFPAAVAIIFGGLGDKVPPAFINDRTALSGRSFDPVTMQAAVPHMEGQIRAHIALLSDQLADGRRFLSGESAGLVDANGYYNLWFIRSAFPPAASLFESMPHIPEWLERVKAIGHGKRAEMSREAALEIARAAEPIESAVAPRDAELEGRQVTVSADDYGRDAVTGLLVGSSKHHVSIRRSDPLVGQVVVHFPRIGFSVRS